MKLLAQTAMFDTSCIILTRGYTMNKKHRGSDFEDFLKEEGIYEEVTLAALKEVIAYELPQAMKSAHVMQDELAAHIGISRSVIR